jgi:hypothetical protein
VMCQHCGILTGHLLIRITRCGVCNGFSNGLSGFCRRCGKETERKRDLRARCAVCQKFKVL